MCMAYMRWSDVHACFYLTAICHARQYRPMNGLLLDLTTTTTTAFGGALVCT